jgi:putative heme-binding domain-containing protein
LISPPLRQQWKQQQDPGLRALAARLEKPVDEAKSDLASLEKVVREGAGDPYQGKKIYKATCSACHRLFGQGGELGPDLTSFQRTDVGALLKQIVAPSAEIREGYEGWMVNTRDGRSFSGFLVQTNARTVVLRTPSAPELSLPRPEIEEMERSRLSLMPEGLLDPLTSEQIRNLFAYLRSTQPLND